MKTTDYSFNIVAAVILAGVVVAFAGPSHPRKPELTKPAAGQATIQAAVDAADVAAPTMTATE